VADERRGAQDMNKALLATIALTLMIVGCGGEDDDMADIPGAMLGVRTNVDVDDVSRAQTIPLVIDTENVYLMMPPATPPPDHAADAGYLQFHFDDESTPPLLADDETHVSVTVPATAASGPHEIICRLHALDGRPTRTKLEIDLRVRPSGTLD
jgi:hypothetical protein